MKRARPDDEKADDPNACPENIDSSVVDANDIAGKESVVDPGLHGIDGSGFARSKLRNGTPFWERLTCKARLT